MRISDPDHALVNPPRRNQTQSAMQSDTRSFEAGPNVSQRSNEKASDLKPSLSIYAEDIRSYNHPAKSRKPNVITARMVTVMTCPISSPNASMFFDLH
jgi:hypothetical protein